nr:hypothetical protein CPGR_01008 [Mycolicibacterium malmesburyense]
MTAAPCCTSATFNPSMSTRMAPAKRTPLARPPDTSTFEIVKSAFDHSLSPGNANVWAAGS